MSAQLLMLLTFAALHNVQSQTVTILESILIFCFPYLEHFLRVHYRPALQQTVFLVFQELQAYQDLTVVTAQKENEERLVAMESSGLQGRRWCSSLLKLETVCLAIVWQWGDNRDFGLIKDCIFQKKHGDTSLRVFYSGALRICNCKSCCKRWFFTFSGAECSGPMPIDGLIYIPGESDLKSLRVRHMEGYCQNILKGGVRVGINVGNCARHANADAHSGWKSVSRIDVE